MGMMLCQWKIYETIINPRIISSYINLLIVKKWQQIVFPITFKLIIYNHYNTQHGDIMLRTLV